MIFAPRSCPSKPGFAMTTRILRATERSLRRGGQDTRTSVSTHADRSRNVPASGAGYLKVREALARSVMRTIRPLASDWGDTRNVIGSGPSAARRTSAGSRGHCARARRRFRTDVTTRTPRPRPATRRVAPAKERLVRAQSAINSFPSSPHASLSVFAPASDTEPATARISVDRNRPSATRSTDGRLLRNVTERMPSDRCVRSHAPMMVGRLV